MLVGSGKNPHVWMKGVQVRHRGRNRPSSGGGSAVNGGGGGGGGEGGGGGSGGLGGSEVGRYKSNPVVTLTQVEIQLDPEPERKRLVSTPEPVK
jgi:hypothetical protein